MDIGVTDFTVVLSSSGPRIAGNCVTSTLKELEVHGWCGEGGVEGEEEESLSPPPPPSCTWSQCSQCPLIIGGGATGGAAGGGGGGGDGELIDAKLNPSGKHPADSVRSPPCFTLCAVASVSLALHYFSARRRLLFYL